MLAASDGTMELDLSDIDELAGTCVIILRVTASKAKPSKGKVQNWTCTGKCRCSRSKARASMDVRGSLGQR